MNWSLIAAGVMAGLGLVIAKQWLDRQVEGPERKAGRRRQARPPIRVGAPAAEIERPHEEDPVSRDGHAGRSAPLPQADEGITAKQATAASSQSDATVTAKRRRSDTLDGDSLAEIVASGDLTGMETALSHIADPVQRHVLLNRLIKGHYRLRGEPKHRDAFYRVAYVQIEEAPVILNAFAAAGKPRPSYLEAFRATAIALSEEGRYDEAIAVCEKALSLGLEDGTKTGFRGRMARLKRHRDAH